jgi:hypothetical protein
MLIAVLTIPRYQDRTSKSRCQFVATALSKGYDENTAWVIRRSHLFRQAMHVALPPEPIPPFYLKECLMLRATLCLAVAALLGVNTARAAEPSPAGPAKSTKPAIVNKASDHKTATKKVTEKSPTAKKTAAKKSAAKPDAA